jgi:cytosine/adenosine deaminase-related metal-dependent hydrolase
MMPQATINSEWLLPASGQSPRRGASISMKDGVISSIDESGVAGSGFAIPALGNAHDHARLVRLSQVDSYDVPLEAWLPYLALMPSVDPWLSSAVAFGRSAAGGVGSVMAHYTRVQGLTDFSTEAKAVAKAARDVGINLAFAVHCRDRNPLVYDSQVSLLESLSPEACACITGRFLKPYKAALEQVEIVEQIAQEIEGDGVNVQYGPAGVQWCSDELLALIGERSAATNRRVHMHLLESRYQRVWADKEYPGGIVKFLDSVGLVNERVSFAHCIHLRPDEMELIAERGATIVVNTSSNIIVSSGLAPVGEFIRRGCRVAMGLDGLAFDEDEDALREMRMCYGLHKAYGFERTMGHSEIIDIASTNARFAVTGSSGGGLSVGAAADVLLLDWDSLSAELVDPDTSPVSLMLARGVKKHVRDLYVGGRRIVADGAVTGVDLPGLEKTLLAELRARFHTSTDIKAAMPELKSALAKHFRGAYYCG